VKRFWTDRIAIGTALVGIGLMILTILWRINPAEGSVVPQFLTSNPVGMGVMWILLITCMPAWIAAVSLSMLIPFSEPIQYGVACGLMMILQCIVYFLLGKLISLGGRKLLRRKES
jgi:hypothetical protein